VKVWRLIPMLMLLTACANGLWGESAVPRAVAPPDDTEQTVSQAEGLVRAGAYDRAVPLFQEVADNPSSAFADRALLGLTKSLCSPDYAGHDYRLAYVMADRLVRDYPDSHLAPEGRAWRDLILAYLARGQEIDRRTMELEQVLTDQARQQQELERLRGVDQELERRTRDLQRRTQELERLRAVDQELERRTRELEQLKRLDLELEQKKRKP
jgi:hypothetical protein